MRETPSYGSVPGQAYHWFELSPTGENPHNEDEIDILNIDLTKLKPAARDDRWMAGAYFVKC